MKALVVNANMFAEVGRAYQNCFITKIHRVKNKKGHWRTYRGKSVFYQNELQTLLKAGNTEVMFGIRTAAGIDLVVTLPFNIKALAGY